MTRSEQLEFESETGWFSFFTDIISSGKMAEMNKECSAASSVLLVIKKHDHIKKFKDWSSHRIPSVRIISEESGFSQNTTRKALEVLKTHGFIRLKKGDGRMSSKVAYKKGQPKVYEYYDNVSITEKKNRVPPINAKLNYHPSQLAELLETIETAVKDMNDGISPNGTPLVSFTLSNEIKNYFYQDNRDGGHGEQNNQGGLLVGDGKNYDQLIKEISSRVVDDELSFGEGTSQIQALLREKKASMTEQD